MRSLDGLHVEVESSCVWVRTNSGISRVRKGTTLTIAETGDVVFIATEVLFFCGTVNVSFSSESQERKTYVNLKEQNC